MNKMVVGMKSWVREKMHALISRPNIKMKTMVIRWRRWVLYGEWVRLERQVQYRYYLGRENLRVVHTWCLCLFHTCIQTGAWSPIINRSAVYPAILYGIPSYDSFSYLYRRPRQQ